jgi:diguanylate cyclase (GGDEF)-like protein
MIRPAGPARPTARLGGALLLLLASLLVWTGAAHALQPIAVTPEQERIEITTLGELLEGRGDNVQLETAPGIDGMTGRMSVRASTPGTSPSWIVFALRNATDKPVERWVTAERYSIAGSGVVWPDLDTRRLEALTPSLGFVPERVRSDRADIFRVTLEPGQTITYVAELASDRFARIYLWKPLEYEQKARDRQLFNGIFLGLVCLLAVFLTAIFAANHKIVFPAAALVAWCVLAYLCVDFGFWHKLFQLRPEDNAVHRAATEAAIAASLVIFLYAFLRLGLWHGFIHVLIVAWIIAQLALVAVAVVDPRLASTFARISFAAIGGMGMVFTLFLALRGQDRALSLIPTWMLFLVWIFGASVILTGRLSGDIVVTGLTAGLVLIVMLMGFTVTQFAFRALEPLYGASPTDVQLRSLAVDGAAAAIWEWNTRRDEFKISPHVEASLGLQPGALSTSVEDFSRHLHPADRERFRLTLWSVQERNGGAIQIDFRMRHTDNSYRWFEIEASSLPASERRAMRCVGLMRDVTDSKRAHERLLHDAVHDSLSGLPNRELFLDRLAVATQRAVGEPNVRPTVIFIDIDKFRGLNTSHGLVVGDSLLLTTARRLARHLGPLDTLARVGGDQFAILLVAEQEPRELAAFSERIRRSLRAPIKIADQEIVLTGSLGIAVYDTTQPGQQSLLRDAEIAMYRAKRGGTDRIEIFRPEMSSDREERLAIEADLAKAVEKGQVRVLYLPIIYLPTEELAGFEAVLRWEHPKLGTTDPLTFESPEESSETIAKLGSFALSKATQDIAKWLKELPRSDAPLFVSVGISSRQLFRESLVQEVRHIFGRELVPKGALRLELDETLMMENPEQAAEILEWLRGAGAELTLDDFGTGYSSIAYLQRFAFDTVKLDSGLVQSATPAGPGTALVRSIVALAHELGKRVVAEGVETAEDVAFLRAIGCEHAQGRYYSEPMAEREVVQLLRAVRKSERKLQRRGFMRAKAKDQRSPRRRETRPQAAAPPPPGEARVGNGVAAAAAASVAAGSRTAGRSAANSARNGSAAPMPPQPMPEHSNGAADQAPAAAPPYQPYGNGHHPAYAASSSHPPNGFDAAGGHAHGYDEAKPTAAHAPPPPEPSTVPPPMPQAHGWPHAQPASPPHGDADEPPVEPAVHDAPAEAAADGDAPPPLPPDLPAAAAPSGLEPVVAHAAAAEADPGPAEAPLPPLSAVFPTEPPQPAARLLRAIEPPAQPQMPELKSLPPAIAASLARLAGLPAAAPPASPQPPPRKVKVSRQDG